MIHFCSIDVYLTTYVIFLVGTNDLTEYAALGGLCNAMHEGRVHESHRDTRENFVCIYCFFSALSFSLL